MPNLTIKFELGKDFFFFGIVKKLEVHTTIYKIS